MSKKYYKKPRLNVEVWDASPGRVAVWVGGTRPFTANQQQRNTPTVANKPVRRWRNAVRKHGQLPLKGLTPFPDPATVVCAPAYKDKRARPDVGAVAPCAKAAIDGLVDLGAWEDDDPDHVVRVVHRVPMMSHSAGDGLLLVVVGGLLIPDSVFDEVCRWG